jgi:MSHA biogenesis protein MshM
VYLDYFGLKELPFSITPDTSFIFYGQSHQEALNTILVALGSGEGFVKVTGEVGTGKTLLCRRLLATLNNGDWVTAYLPNPKLEAKVFLHAVAEELGLKIDMGSDEFFIVKHLNDALVEFARHGKKVVLCLDEVQAMPLESLETLRLLSNLETEKRKLVQVVMFGQPELDIRLANPSVRQLRQRIAFHYQLIGLSPLEIEDYLAHRLRVAGFRGHPLFVKGLGKPLHLMSKGVPRLINILAHKALLQVFGEGESNVSVRHFRAAARDTESAFPAPWWYLGGW